MCRTVITVTAVGVVCLSNDTRTEYLVTERDDVEFGVFYGVSDNDRRWFSIEHGRDIIGYNPQDNSEEWNAPPKRA